MTIYAKTNPGRLLAFDQAQDVPANWRDMLRRVDGKTRQEQLLLAPGDEALLQVLAQRGLIQVVSTPWRNSISDSRSQAFDSSLSPDQGVASNTSHSAKIDSVIALMILFIQTSLPEYADSTLREITALNNKAELLCMLTGYIDLANRAGKVGQKHVQQLLLELAKTNT